MTANTATPTLTTAGTMVADQGELRIGQWVEYHGSIQRFVGYSFEVTNKVTDGWTGAVTYHLGGRSDCLHLEQVRRRSMVAITG